MKYYKILNITIIYLITLSYCIKSKGAQPFENVQLSESPVRTYSFPKNVITIKKGKFLTFQDVKEGLTNYVELTILLNWEMKDWIKDYSKNIDKYKNITFDAFIALKKNEFFKSYFIQEDEYTQFYINNMYLIEEFLNKSPEYRDAYYNSFAILR